MATDRLIVTTLFHTTVMELRMRRRAAERAMTS